MIEEENLPAGRNVIVDADYMIEQACRRVEAGEDLEKVALQLAQLEIEPTGDDGS